MSEAGAKLVRGLLEPLLLLALSRGPRHGYALLKEIEELAGEAPNRNKIYPLLARLEAQGLVEREGTDASGPGRGRTMFALTDAGREELDRLRRLPAPLRAALGELWAQVAPTQPGVDARPARLAAEQGAEGAAGGATAAPTATATDATASAASAATGPRPTGFVPILAAPPPVAPGALPYPCPDARVLLEKDPRTGALGLRLTGCPMGAYTYCPQCPVFQSVEGIRRLTLG